jgi:hypothetical protein
LKKQNLVLQSELAKKEIEMKDLLKKLQQQQFQLNELNEENKQIQEEYHVQLISSFCERE